MSELKHIPGTTLLLIVITMIGGCSKKDDRWQPYLFRHEGRWVAFKHIAIDRDGTKWFATSMGIRKFDGREWTVYDTKNSPLPHNAVNTVFVDSKGYIWAASWYHGVVRFDPNAQSHRAWTVITKADGLVDNYVLAIAEDQEGNMWFGTFDGASKLTPRVGQEEWTTLRPENSGLTSTTVTAIAVDDSGHIWFGTDPMWIRSGYVGGGVSTYNPFERGPSAWTTYDTVNSGLPSNAVRTLAVESPPNGNSVWIGTDRGLSQFKRDASEIEQWKTYDNLNSAIPSDVVNAIAFDQSGNLWVASADMGTAEAFKIGGVSMFDGTEWTTFTVANSNLQDNRALYLAADKHDNIWICGFVGVDVYNAQGVVRVE